MAILAHARILTFVLLRWLASAEETCSSSLLQARVDVNVQSPEDIEAAQVGNDFPVLADSRSAPVQTRPTIWIKGDATTYDKSLGDSPSSLFMRLAGFTLIFAFVFCVWQIGVSGSDQASTVRNKIFVVQCAATLTYSLPILDSYDLSHAIGENASFSGKMVGMYYLASLIGGSLVWVLSMRFPAFWRHGWTIIAVGLSCNIVSTCMYMSVVVSASAHHLDARLSSFLMCARIVGGIGQGMIAQWGSTTVVRVTPSAERPWQMVNFMLANMIGIGLGPLLAAAVETVYPPWIGPAYLNVILLLAVLVWLPFRLPSLEPIVDTTDVGQGKNEVQDPSLLTKQRLVLAGCLIMGMLRGYAVAALEVGSALLLEITFRWPVGKIGPLISCVILVAIPVSLIFKQFKEKLSLTTWIRVMYTICLFGNSLLFASHSLGGWVLLLADAFAFPTIYVAEALSLGIMQKHLLPPGSIFADTNTSMLWRMCLTNGIGRLCGPWFARLFIQQGGILPYSLSQVVVTCTFALIFELAVNPSMIDDGDKKVAS